MKSFEMPMSKPPSAERPSRETAESFGFLDRWRGRLSSKEAEKLEASRGVAEALRGAIAASLPERAEAERLRADVEAALEGEIESFGALGRGSADGPIFLYVKDVEAPAVYKPAARSNSLRTSLSPESGPYREWLVSQIDRCLGLDVVPVMIIRTGPEGLGSAQAWVDGATLASGAAEPRQDDLMRIGFLDALVGAYERHRNNVMVGEGGRASAVDNTMVFSDDPGEGLHSTALDAVGGQPVPESLREAADRFRGAPDVREALHAAFRLALGAEAEDAWRQFLRRLDACAPPQRAVPADLPRSMDRYE